jgi:cell division protein FtsQ
LRIAEKAKKLKRILPLGWNIPGKGSEKAATRRIFAGKLLSHNSRVIRTAKSSPQRRQTVKRRKRILVAKRQRVIRALVSTAKLSAFVAALTILTIDVLDYVYASPRFSVVHIAVAGNTHVTADQLIEKSGIIEGQNIFRVSIRDTVSAIEQIPWVDRARVDKVFPNEVHIEITERKPVALVLSHKLFLIDGERKVMSEFDASEGLQAPIITAKQIDGLKPGDTVEIAGISEALDIVRFINDMNLEECIGISEICIDAAPNISMIAERSGANIMLGSSDFEERIWRLTRVAGAISRQQSMRLANLESIDMRFKSIVPAKFKDS